MFYVAVGYVVCCVMLYVVVRYVLHCGVFQFPLWCVTLYVVVCYTLRCGALHSTLRCVTLYVAVGCASHCVGCSYLRDLLVAEVTFRQQPSTEYKQNHEALLHTVHPLVRRERYSLRSQLIGEKT